MVLFTTTSPIQIKLLKRTLTFLTWFRFQLEKLGIVALVEVLWLPQRGSTEPNFGHPPKWTKNQIENGPVYHHISDPDQIIDESVLRQPLPIELDSLDHFSTFRALTSIWKGFAAQNWKPNRRATSIDAIQSTSASNGSVRLLRCLFSHRDSFSVVSFFYSFFSFSNLIAIQYGGRGRNEGGLKLLSFERDSIPSSSDRLLLWATKVLFVFVSLGRVFGR